MRFRNENAIFCFCLFLLENDKEKRRKKLKKYNRKKTRKLFLGLGCKTLLFRFFGGFWFLSFGSFFVFLKEAERPVSCSFRRFVSFVPQKALS